eukprot:7272676-Pyramimonas_sp.AAC.1
MRLAVASLRAANVCRSASNRHHGAARAVHRALAVVTSRFGPRCRPTHALNGKSPSSARCSPTPMKGALPRKLQALDGDQQRQST